MNKPGKEEKRKKEKEEVGNEVNQKKKKNQKIPMVAWNQKRKIYEERQHYN